jgi:glycine hydroxymethyltransferase
MNTILAKAVAFNEALKPEFATYSQKVIDNAKVLADELMKRGLKLVTNGTDNHLLVIDVYKSLGINGNEAEVALDAAGLTVNKNVIPDDELPPFRPSGVRLGTPAITTRGFGTEHMSQLAEWIDTGLRNTKDEKKLASIKAEVKELASQFPLPSDS